MAANEGGLCPRASDTIGLYLSYTLRRVCPAVGSYRAGTGQHGDGTDRDPLSRKVYAHHRAYGQHRDFILHEYDPSAPVTIVPTPVRLSAYEDLDPAYIQADLDLQGVEVLLCVGRIAGEKLLSLEVGPQRWFLQGFIKVICSIESAS